MFVNAQEFFLCVLTLGIFRVVFVYRFVDSMIKIRQIPFNSSYTSQQYTLLYCLWNSEKKLTVEKNAEHLFIVINKIILRIH